MIPSLSLSLKLKSVKSTVPSLFALISMIKYGTELPKFFIAVCESNFKIAVCN